MLDIEFLDMLFTRKVEAKIDLDQLNSTKELDGNDRFAEERLKLQVKHVDSLVSRYMEIIECYIKSHGQ